MHNEKTKQKTRKTIKKRKKKKENQGIKKYNTVINKNTKRRKKSCWTQGQDPAVSGLMP